tara:strand:+ start:27437 stop:28396 length:960 start_codon:yes stop_codon:yes gene_type:complete
MEIYGLALILLSGFSIIYLKLAKKFNIVDKPNHRSSHTRLTIRGGGILFVFGLIIYFVISDFKYPYFVLGTMIVAILSFIDDVITLSAKIRWPFQVIAIILLFYQVGFENFSMWTYLPIMILALGFVNFFNFMDGINGITGLSSLVVIVGFYYLNQTYPVVDDSFLIILSISVLVFGFFNFRKKAIMFAGDIGSITMAMILFFLGVKYIITTESALIFCLYIVFGADSTLTVFYRIYKREKLSDAHRQHIYQKLVDNFKLSHLKVSMYYTVLQVFISVFTFYVFFNIEVKYHFIIGVLISLILTAFYIYLFKKNEKKLQ